MVWDVGPRLGVAAVRQVVILLGIDFWGYPAVAATPRRGPTVTGEPYGGFLLLGELGVEGKQAGDDFGLG